MSAATAYRGNSYKTFVILNGVFRRQGPGYSLAAPRRKLVAWVLRFAQDDKDVR